MTLSNINMLETVEQSSTDTFDIVCVHKRKQTEVPRFLGKPTYPRPCRLCLFAGGVTGAGQNRTGAVLYRLFRDNVRDYINEGLMIGNPLANLYHIFRRKKRLILMNKAILTARYLIMPFCVILILGIVLLIIQAAQKLLFYSRTYLLSQTKMY